MPTSSPPPPWSDPRLSGALRMVGYGVALAVLAWLLEWLDFRWRVRAGAVELYVALIAVIFAGLGVWVGRRLTARPAPSSGFEPNRNAIEYLGLTDRELELLGLVAEGCSNREIAKRAFISTNTVKTHLKSVFQKLDVSRRTQAVRKARELRIIP